VSNLLAIEGLQVRLPIAGEPRVVLRDVDLEIEAGGALALVGESGSGKSMTARSVARLLPDRAEVSGTIRFGGQDVLGLSDAALRSYRSSDIAMVFQDPRVHVNPVRTIGDFLVEGLVTNGKVRRSVAEATMVRLLEEVGIADGRRRLRQYPHQLSGGLLQRVMIAAALAGNPRLLLADEPTTALDVSTQSDVMALLDDLRRDRGMAMLFITHDIELAATVCDRIAVMYAGEVVEVDDSEALLDRPRHPYTAGLLGARPDITRRQPRLRAVPGRPLAAFEAPLGCAFSDRCPYRVDDCLRTHPPLAPVRGVPTRCLRGSELDLAVAVSP
jgi:oligopeptide/dipeptide ABC transporter ATP-binding protein